MPVVRVMMILVSVMSGHLVGIEVNRMNTDLKWEVALCMRVVNVGQWVDLAEIERHEREQEHQR